MEDLSPYITKFQDPHNWTETFNVAKVSFLQMANNHQFDFGDQGINNTITTLRQHNLNYGGIGSMDEITKPFILQVKGVKVAIYTLVAKTCLYDSCTCGKTQCFTPTVDVPGLWFFPEINEKAIKDITSTIHAFVAKKEVDMTIVMTHCGVQWSWKPEIDTPTRVALFHSLIDDAGVDLIFATSASHVQPLEFYKGKPIVYGPGQLLFRHLPGVEDHCRDFAFPCGQFRPELSFLYKFSVQFTGDYPANITSIQVYPTRHDDWQVNLADKSDTTWLITIFNQISAPFNVQAKQTDTQEWLIFETDEKPPSYIPTASPTNPSRFRWEIAGTIVLALIALLLIVLIVKHYMTKNKEEALLKKEKEEPAESDATQLLASPSNTDQGSDSEIENPKETIN